MESTGKIFFCEACGARILEAAAVPGRDGKLVCPVCRVASTARPHPATGTGQISARASGREEAAARDRASAPDSRTPVKAARDPRTVLGLVMGAVGLGLMLVSLWIYLKGNREKPPADSPRAQAAPAPVLPPPPSEAKTRIEKPEPGPATPAPVLSEEAQAREALEKVLRFEGLAAEDREGRALRLEEYLARHGQSIAAARARTLLEGLKKKDAPAPPPPPIATPAPAPAPAPTGIPTSLRETFDGPACPIVTFGKIEERPPEGGSGKALLLVSHQVKAARAGLGIWNMPKGTPQRDQRILLIPPPGAVLRLRYYNVDGTAMKVRLVNPAEEVWEWELAKVEKGVWTRVEIPVREFRDKEGRAYPEGKPCQEVLIVALGPSAPRAYLDELEISSP